MQDNFQRVAQIKNSQKVQSMINAKTFFLILNWNGKLVGKLQQSFSKYLVAKLSSNSKRKCVQQLLFYTPISSQELIFPRLILKMVKWYPSLLFKNDYNILYVIFHLLRETSIQFQKPFSSKSTRIYSHFFNMDTLV